ncbi:MAG TPA: Gldg family protein [Rhodanobacteraceae bacterium]|nr:Gldg family protein [Rhodanobacteraceae bacterium]
MRLSRRPRLRASVALLLLLIIYLVLLWASAVGLRGARVDLTADKLYTLSPGTLHIASSLRQPLQLTLYFSDRVSRELPQLRAYRQRVGDMLEEIARNSDGRIVLKVVDPQPYSEDQDRAAAAGLSAMPGNNGEEKLYFGLAARNLADGRSASIPFFLPDREPYLEYDLAKLILDLSQARKPRVDIISSLPIEGGTDAATGQPQRPWTVLQQLRQLFDVHRLQADSLKAIGDDTAVLLLIQPRDLPPDAVYAIDQYVLRGGRLVAFVDPDAELEGGQASGLPKLFRAWGIVFDASQVLLDRDRALTIQPTPDSAPVRHPAVLGFSDGDLNHDDPVTASLGAINVSSAGHFELAPQATTRLVPLIQSSGDAMLVPAQRVREASDPASLYNGYAPTGEHYAIAVRAIGRFTSAFPERHDPGHVARSQREDQVLLVADTDMLSDRLWVQFTPSFGQVLANAFANNGDFFVNAVDSLAGPSDLIAIRGRAVADRPFTTVENLRHAADEKFKAKQNELLVELADTEARLSALQSRGSTALNASQKNAVAQFMKRKLQIRGELREVQQRLNADIERLAARLKFIDILLMPIVLTLLGLVYAAWRAHRRRRARGAFA